MAIEKKDRVAQTVKQKAFQTSDKPVQVRCG